MSALMPTYKRLPVAFVRGRGALLYDQYNKEYIDGVSGIAVTNLGHCHPAVTAAINEQAQSLVHTSNLYRIPQQELLATQLSAMTGMEALFFCNSGAEANETAIKLARRYGHGKGIETPSIIVLESAFHGRTMGALAATGNRAIQTEFAPMLPGFVRIPRNDIEAMRAAARDSNVVAVLLEPVQGEGGVWPLDTDYLAAVKALCREQDWLLMFDEVQSGNGRCGMPYAYQRLNVVPDVLVTAKGLGNGFPIGCCMAKGRAAQVLSPGDHGTTYGGNPLACAAASAVINTLSAERLYESAEPIRAAVIAGLQDRLEAPEKVVDIRGLGLMIGIEVAVASDTLVLEALKRQTLINVTAGNVIRLLPPLVMTTNQAHQLGQTVADILNSQPAT